MRLRSAWVLLFVLLAAAGVAQPVQGGGNTKLYLTGVGQLPSKGAYVEKWLPSFIADNRSYQYRHQRPIFHTADCQHFESENGACQRCAENRPETCGNTRHQDDAGTLV